MSKSLGRLDAVQNVKTELDTQSSTLTFKPGRPIDFAALAKAVDKAGFKAGSITIWAKGALSQAPDGRLMFTMSDSHQSFPVADSPEAARLKTMGGMETPIVARVQFEETPPRLVLGEEPARAGTEGMGGMKGMGK